MASQPLRLFDTDRRIRLGIWGLGRGMSFYRTCAALNIDVVAGCDFNEHMRQSFAQQNPGAYVSADADEFLAQDFDAVLLATFCPAHADDAIKCLRAGKHVLSEVTAFHTMAEGVRLVEAVEGSGKVYNLAENYPFSAANMYLARKWKEGLFGDLMYAEYEYVHECRSLAYTYIDGLPVQPGNTVHSWRSWLQFHYYCTHSLGPVMVITGTRPTRVVALPGKQTLAGYLMTNEHGMGGMTPSLINMSNGGIVRNLMGATTNDTHVQRLWGTLGAAELNVGRHLSLRLGASGGGPKLEVNPTWEGLGELAAKTGHGGGDFWVLYYFARQILTGEPGPFDIYGASDVTIPGILAYRSSTENGKPYDVPDFRDNAQRQAWRDDNWAQKRYNHKAVFPASCKYEITQHFSKTMADLIRHATNYRAYADWGKVEKDLVRPADYGDVVERLALSYDDLLKTYAMARKIVKACPGTDGARVLTQMLEIGEEKTATTTRFKAQLLKRFAAIKRKYQSGRITAGTISRLFPPAPIESASPAPRGAAFTAAPYLEQSRLIDIRPAHNGKDGIVYLRCAWRSTKAQDATLFFGVDGPTKVWVNGKAVAVAPKATNPAVADQYQAAVKLRQGVNSIVFGIHSNKGNAWGAIARLELA